MHKLISIWRAMFLFVIIALASPAFGTTTTLNFDTISNNQPLTTQYESIGVVASGGGIVLNSSFTFWDPAQSPPNLLYASTSTVTFTLNSAMLNNVQSMSVYVAQSSTTVPVVITAFDTSGNVVAQTSVPANASSWVQYSLMSAGNAVAKVQFVGQAGNYGIDTLSFNSGIPLASYNAAVYLAPKLASFAATETFTLGANSPPLNPATQPLTLNVGTLNISLPGGSFETDGPPRLSTYVYRGTVNNVDLYVSIRPTRTSRSYELFVLGTRYAFQTGLSTIPISITIDNNSGNANVVPRYVPVVPYSP